MRSTRDWQMEKLRAHLAVALASVSRQKGENVSHLGVSECNAAGCSLKWRPDWTRKALQLASSPEKCSDRGGAVL